MLVQRSFRRLARTVAVAAASLVVVFAAASYVLAPVSEAIGATVTAITSSGGHSAIEGKIVEGKAGARGVKVEILGSVRVKSHGKWVTKREIIGRATVGRNGKFKVPVKPGHYWILIEDGTQAKRTLHVTVKHGKSIFVAGTIKKHAGGLSIAPVVFNY